MSKRLRAVHLKLIRAEEHLNAFKAEVAVFREIEPYQVVQDRDSDPDALLIRVQTRQMPQARWSIIFGDFLHNLRSALDLLANQLVKAAGNEPITEGRNKTQFPTMTERPGGDGKAQIWGGVSKRAAALVDALQPYTWDDPSLHPLAILSRLSNKDKHRQLNFFLTFLPGIETSFGTGLDALIRQLHPGPFLLDHEIRLPYEGDFTREVQVNVYYTPVVFAGERWEQDGEIVAFADYLFEFICQKVIARFSRVCFPEEPAVHLAHPLGSGRVRQADGDSPSE